MFSIILGSMMGAPAWIAAVLIAGFIPAILITVLLGLPTALLMRRVRNQWLHVLAFLAAGGIAGVIWGGFGSFSPIFAMTIGISAAVGRLSAWKLARVHDAPSDPAP